MAETIRKTLDLNKDIVDWVNEVYPETSFTWLVNRCLESLKKAHEENPIDYFSIGANYLKQEIQNG